MGFRARACGRNPELKTKRLIFCGCSLGPVTGASASGGVPSNMVYGLGPRV